MDGGKRLRRAFGLLAIAAVALSSGVAGAERPPIIKLGLESFLGNGGFRPRKLPRKGFSPLSMELDGRVQSPVGSHSPPLQEAVFEIDRHVRIDPKALPICRPGNVDEGPPQERCRSALVGRGTIGVEVEFSESPPFEVADNLYVFNGRAKEGTPTLLIYAYLESPVNGAIGSENTISRVSHGRYGIRLPLSFPKIAGGAGWVKEFSLTIGRFAHAAKSKNYLVGQCADGHLNLAVTATFSDGSTETDSVVRACTPKG